MTDVGGAPAGVVDPRLNKGLDGVADVAGAVVAGAAAPEVAGVVWPKRDLPLLANKPPAAGAVVAGVVVCPPNRLLPVPPVVAGVVDPNKLPPAGVLAAPPNSEPPAGCVPAPPNSDPPAGLVPAPPNKDPPAGCVLEPPNNGPPVVDAPAPAVVVAGVPPKRPPPLPDWPPNKLGLAVEPGVVDVWPNDGVPVPPKMLFVSPAPDVAGVVVAPGAAVEDGVEAAPKLNMLDMVAR